MSTVYNPEAEIIAEIERLELELRQLRRSLDKAAGAEDKRVLRQQMVEVEETISALRGRLPS